MSLLHPGTIQMQKAYYEVTDYERLTSPSYTAGIGGSSGRTVKQKRSPANNALPRGSKDWTIARGTVERIRRRTSHGREGSADGGKKQVRSQV